MVGSTRTWVRRGALALGAVAIVALAWLGFRCVPRGTHVSPHAYARIEHARNVLWCATAQLAWDRAAEAAGTKGLPVQHPADPEDVAAMNRDPFPVDALDPKTFVALGGLAEDGICEKFEKALVATFGEVPDGVRLPAMSPSSSQGKPGAAFAYLLKVMRFEREFEQDREGISFRVGPLPWIGRRTVKAFGAGRKGNMGNEVRLHWQDDSEDPGEFILELRPESNDRILLARVDAQETLWDTWRSVAARLDGEGQEMPPFDRLAIPIVDVGKREASFSSLCGPFVDGQGQDGSLDAFEQWTKFRLDEKGARLESFASIRMTMAQGGGSPPPLPEYVFDRPFLLALMERGATRPYFLLWVANADLLVPAD